MSSEIKSSEEFYSTFQSFFEKLLWDQLLLSFDPPLPHYKYMSKPALFTKFFYTIQQFVNFYR